MDYAAPIAQRAVAFHHCAMRAARCPSFQKRFTKKVTFVLQMRLVQRVGESFL
jgi:hypothetical protein